MFTKDVAIIGISGIYPDCENLQGFHRNLCEGIDSVRQISESRREHLGIDSSVECQKIASIERIDEFDHAFFGLSLREAELMDPHQRLLLQLTCTAIENAGYRLTQMKGERVAVVFSASHNAYAELINDPDPDPTAITGNLSAALAGRVSYALDLRGPAMVIDTACSSSLVAIYEACKHLYLGEAEYALAGGVNIFLSEDRFGSNATGIVAPDGRSKAFDASADGAGWGEGGGVVLLKLLSRAQADGDVVHAVIKGGAVNQDGGRSNGMAAPSPHAQAELITSAWKNAAIDPLTISYIEAHGTGTQLGDPIEIQGITDAFRRHTERDGFCAVGSVKTNIGHLVGAAGVAGLTKVVQSLKHRQLFPTVHFKTPNPFLNLATSPVYVNANFREWSADAPRRAGLSSFGLSGTNAHLIIEEAPPRVEPCLGFDEGNAVLVTLSAKTPAALDDYLRGLSEYLEYTDEQLSNIAYTLNCGRDAYENRFATVASSKEELRASIMRALEGDTGETSLPGARSVVFLCSGDAPCVDPDTSRRLYKEYVQYQKAIDECNKTKAGDAETEYFGRFTHLYALYRLWESLGLSTRHVLGSGIGNLVVGVVTGRITLSQCFERVSDINNSEGGIDREKLKAVLKGLPQNPLPVFLEIGGEGTLSREIRALGVELGVPPLVNPDYASSDGLVLATMAELYSTGVNIGWERYYKGRSLRRVECPTYPFQRTRCWVRGVARKGEREETTLNRAELPSLNVEVVSDVDATECQRRLGVIWGEVLKLEEIALDDDFFALGGSSLNEVRLVGRIEKEYGIKLDFNEVYDYPTIRSLSERISELGGITEESVSDSETCEGRSLESVTLSSDIGWQSGMPSEGVVSLPLSHGQLRLWAIDQQEKGSPVYNIPTDVKLKGILHTHTLEKCLREVVRRHDVLRTTFSSEGGAPRQLIAPQTEMSLSLIDLSALPYPERDGIAHQLAIEESRAPFNLEKGPLFRVRLVRLSRSEHLLLLTMHHIISDGWSSGVLIRELTLLYNAYHAGVAQPLEPLPMQYGDFVSWEREWLEGRDIEADVTYWKEQLADCPDLLELPTDRPRPAVQTFKGARQYLRLSPHLTESLRAFCKSRGFTPYMVLLAGFQALLHRYSGQADVAVGTPVANRHRVETEPLIGFFVNTLVMRTDLGGNPTFTELLRRVKSVALGAYAHQALPFDRLVEELRPVRKQSHAPFFQHIFVLQNTPSDSELIPGLNIEPYEVDRGSSMFDMTITLGEGSEQINGWWEYSTDLFDHATITKMIARYERLLEVALAEPERRLWDISLLSDEERANLLASTRGCMKEFPRDATVHRLFEAQVARTPDAIAVRSNGEAITYNELNRRANQLANRLKLLGAGAGTLVALYVERSIEMVVGLLGVLKSGAAYLPVDLSYPRERFRHVIKDSNAALVLTKRRMLEHLCEFDILTVCLDDVDIEVEDEHNPSCGGYPESLAYVIYTSGSTGLPKGVMVPHRGLVNYLSWCTEAYDVMVGEGAPVHSSLGFDLTITGLLPPLLTGRTVTLVREGEGVDALADVIRYGDNFSLIKITPSHLEALNQRLRPEELAGRARALVIGGEALTNEMLAHWRSNAPETRLINEYGPTETVVGCCVYEVPEGDARSGAVPIGRPIANTQLYVLDRRGGLSPKGVHGELYIGGEGVAYGYLNRPSLTAEKFIPDSFSSVPGARLYRTGDRVRLLPDGQLEFIGRSDDQVKIRGFRVEIGEIEATLLRHESVREAVVIAVSDAAERVRLIAFITHADGEEPSTEVLKNWLKDYVPDYMVPNSFHVLASLPLTTNGKVDRRSLSEKVKEVSSTEKSGAEPRTPMEAALVCIWAEVLGLENVGIHDNFYELGGDSIINIQVIARAKREGMHFTPREFLQNQTIAELATLLSGRHDESQRALTVEALASEEVKPTPSEFALAGIDAASIENLLKTNPNFEDIYGLTATQSGMLYHTLSEPGAYIEQLSWELHGPLDHEAFAGAWQRVIDRHTALRTSFDWEAAREPVQIVHHHVEVLTEALDWCDNSEEEVGRRLNEFLASDRERGFVLSEAPLMRLTLIKLSDECHRLVWTHHHLLLDGWSMPIILKEVFGFYDALISGRDLPLENAQPYKDYVEWSAAQDLAEAERFWRARVGDFNAPTPLPGAHKVSNSHAYTPADISLHVSRATTAELSELSRRTHVTLGTLLHGAWALLLNLYSGYEDVLFGSTVAGRPSDLPGVDSMVGLFINTLPVRVRVTDDESLLTWLERLHEAQLEARQYEHAPLRLIQSWSGVEGGAALFDSVLVVENYPVGKALRERAVGSGKGTHVSGLVARSQTNYPLTIVVESGAELTLRALYDSSRMEEWAAKGMLRHFERLLEVIVENPDRKLSELDLLVADERRKLIEEWNVPSRAQEVEATLQELFEAQVARTPDATAVSFDGQKLTYGELNHRANQLAWRLQHLCGAGPEMLVAICLERSLDMITALLGVLKAGGAYVPVDPASPPERVAWILEDTRASLLITEEHLLDSLPSCSAMRVCLAAERESLALERDDTPPCEATAHNLAYVIYTSGSTGKPKGTPVTHHNVTRLFSATDHWFSFSSEDVWTLFHSYAFDFSVWEMWGALLHGGRLVIVSHQISRSPSDFLELLVKEQVTVLNQTPSAFRLLAQSEQATGTTSDLSLRFIIFGGEALELQSLKGWFERHGDSEPRLVNMYGITETTVHVTFRPLSKADAESPDGSVVGVPIQDLQVYILDRRMRPVPVGVAGEMYVGGEGLARGYLNQPGLTAERFVPHPFNARSGSRLYRSGDLARYQPNGDIEYLGRIDQQVKIRGHRVELGEIETVLNSHEAVRECVVTARDDVTFGAKRLVAYVVGEEGHALGSSEILRWLRDKLPEYMTPSSIVLLDALPLTGNGKLDRRALPAPDQLRPELEDVYAAPRNKDEETLARIWADVLGIDRVGIHDNLFELGGDSILSIQVTARARQAGLHLTPRQVFLHPTVAELATLASSSTGVLASQDEVTGPLQLTPIQHWFFEQNLSNPHHWNQSLLFEVRELMDVRILREAIAFLLVHHDALRLRFVRDENGWNQSNALADELVPFAHVDLSSLPNEAMPAEMERMADIMQASIDLSAGPLLRVVLFDLGSSQPARLLFVIHHLAVDGVSWRILLEDLLTVYRQLKEGGRGELGKKTTSYKYWADRLVKHAQSRDVKDEADFWLGELSAYAEPLPVDFVKGTNTVGSAREITVSLDQEETRSLLRDLPAVYGTQINDALLTALARAFSRWTEASTLLVDVEGHGREDLFDDVDLTRTVGWFTSIYPFPLRLREAILTEDALAQTKRRLRALPRNGIGYGLLRYLCEDTVISARFSSLTRAEVSFNYLGQFDQMFEVEGGLALAREMSGRARNQDDMRPYLLDVNCVVTGGQLRATWTYSEHLHKRRTIESLARNFVEALRSLKEPSNLTDASNELPTDFTMSNLSGQKLHKLLDSVVFEGVE